MFILLANINVNLQELVDVGLFRLCFGVDTIPSKNKKDMNLRLAFEKLSGDVLQMKQGCKNKFKIHNQLRKKNREY